MDNIVNSLRSLFSTYGFKAGMIIIGIIVIVDFTKKPITNLALKKSAQYGYDKSVITRYISILPIIVSFVLTAFVELVAFKFQFMKVEWSSVTANSLVYAAIAVATYETLKKQLQAYAAKTNYSKIENNNESTEASVSAEIINTETESAKTEKVKTVAIEQETAVSEINEKENEKDVEIL